MPSFQLLFIVLFTYFVKFAQMQMMPEYDDYPQYPEPGQEHMPPDGHEHMPPRGRGDPYGMGQGAKKMNEIVIGSKRFKLYEKKRLNFKRAKEFCRKKDGKLAEAKTIEEMRRLETLFMRARMIGMDVWVGADKKKWKKHSLKNMDHPGLNLDKGGMESAGIKAMMMGGGMKEMCPAISLSTRNMAPVMCQQPLPFICEYDKNRPKTTKKPKAKGNISAKSAKKQPKKKKPKRKDEMK